MTQYYPNILRYNSQNAQFITPFSPPRSPPPQLKFVTPVPTPLLPTSMSIFGHLKSTDRAWIQALDCFAQILKSWAHAKRCMPSENAKSLDLIRQDLALKLGATESAVRKSNDRYFHELMHVGNALMELVPKPNKTKGEALTAALGVEKLKALADKQMLARNRISKDIAKRELTTMEVRVRDVDRLFQENIRDLETRGIFEELWAAVMRILEERLAGARADATYFDLDVRYRTSILKILAS